MNRADNVSLDSTVAVQQPLSMQWSMMRASPAAMALGKGLQSRSVNIRDKQPIDYFKISPRKLSPPRQQQSTVDVIRDQS